MKALSQPWVNELLKALQVQSNQKLGVFETTASSAAVLSFEPAPRIWIYEKIGKTPVDDHSIFSFVTDERTPTFACDLEKYPGLRNLIARYCPTEYVITDPYAADRKKKEKISELKEEKRKLFKLYERTAKRHDKLVDEINELERY